MKNTPYFLILFLILPALLLSQKTDAPKNSIGVSAQFYPAGFIPTLNWERQLGEKTSMLIRLGINSTDRQDFSDENDTETGTGFGGSLGLRKRYEWGKGQFVAGFHTDIWSLEIDWTDTDQAMNPTAGSTYTLVVQPWLEAGYFLPIKNAKSQLGLSLGFGREINVITSGDPVAQGFIGSVLAHYMIAL